MYAWYVQVFFQAVSHLVQQKIRDFLLRLAAYKSPKRYKKYGSQKGWERVNQAPPEGDGFQEITEEEARQMELPF